MTPDIIRKLTKELDAGITTEVQVVYVLVGIRKIIERDKLERKYGALKFHCDWALHPSMDRASAKEILMPFETAHPLLNKGVELAELPSDLGHEIDRLVRMKSFKNELARILKTYGLPSLTQQRSNGWTHFLHLYTKVIEDIPLVLKGSGAPHISQVTVGCELARETRHDPYGIRMSVTSSTPTPVACAPPL
jgi:hypothetical protein